MAIQDVVCGDSYKIAAQYIDDKTVIVTDPPYNIKYHYQTYKDNKKDEDYWKDLAYLFSLAPSCVVMYPENLFILSSWMNQIPMKVCSWVYNANTEKQHRDAAYICFHQRSRVYNWCIASKYICRLPRYAKNRWWIYLAICIIWNDIITPQILIDDFEVEEKGIF